MTRTVDELERLLHENVENDGSMEEYQALLTEQHEAMMWGVPHQNQAAPLEAPTDDSEAVALEDLADRATVALAEAETKLNTAKASGTQAQLRIATREFEQASADATSASEQAVEARKAFQTERDWHTVALYETEKDRKESFAAAQRQYDAVIAEIEKRVRKPDGSIDTEKLRYYDYERADRAKQELDRVRAVLDLPVTAADRDAVKAKLDERVTADRARFQALLDAAPRTSPE